MSSREPIQEAGRTRLVLLLAWCAVIFILSEIPGSGKNIDPPLWYVLERKSAHIFEYAVLTFLGLRFFSIVYSRERRSRVMLVTGAFALAYGAFDELHQAFVFGRGARLSDVAIDGLGILLAFGLIFFLSRRPER